MNRPTKFSPSCPLAMGCPSPDRQRRKRRRAKRVQDKPRALEQIASHNPGQVLWTLPTGDSSRLEVVT